MANIISDVNSVVTGIDNANLDVFTGAAIAADPDLGDGASAQGVYTLFGDDGYVIAAIVVGEDAGSTEDYAFVISDSVSREEYGNDGDQWRWSREVVINGEVTEISYENDRIVITEPSGARSILTLADGRATTITGVAANNHYPDDYTFTYDANGYIATSTWTQNPDKTYSAKSIYTVVNGCMTQVREDEDSEEWYGGNASYTNNPEQTNNLNIDLFGISDFITTTDLDRIYLVGAGGNRLKKLPSTIDYGENGIDTYRYTMEGEDISKIEIDEDGEPLTILEIVYAD